MKIPLQLRTDLTCSICFKPITDSKRANIFWRSRERGHPMITIAHSQTCDTRDLWKRYSTWRQLKGFINKQDEMRLYFNSKLHLKEFTRRDVKEGLERIFVSVPDEYFNVSEKELL